MPEKNWTAEDEAAVEAQIRDAPRVMREHLFARQAEARLRRERSERRRDRLRRFSFGLLGR